MSSHENKQGLLKDRSSYSTRSWSMESSTKSSPDVLLDKQLDDRVQRKRQHERQYHIRETSVVKDMPPWTQDSQSLQAETTGLLRRCGRHQSRSLSLLQKQILVVIN